jgi:hypothetical protein
MAPNSVDTLNVLALEYQEGLFIIFRYLHENPTITRFTWGENAVEESWLRLRQDRRNFILLPSIRGNGCKLAFCQTVILAPHASASSKIAKPDMGKKIFKPNLWRLIQ